MRGFRAVLFFLLRFVAVSAVLYLIYTKWGIYYMKLVAYGSEPLLSLFGYEMVLERALKVTEQISLNPLVYLSLVSAVGGVAFARRLKAALWGIAILTVANIATVFLAFMSFYRNSEQLWSGTEFLNLTINFFLPLLLWIIFMPVGEIFSIRAKPQ
jgi:hypothetical protein